MSVFQLQHPPSNVFDTTDLADSITEMEIENWVNEVALEVIFYAVYTTGVERDARIIAFSAYKPERGEYFTSLVNPEMNIPELATRVYNISNETVAQAPTFNQLWIEFSSWAQAPRDGVVRKVVMFANNNINYAKQYLRSETARLGTVLPQNWIWGDICVLTRILRLPRKLEELRTFYQISSRGRQDIENEVYILYEIFTRMIGNVGVSRAFQVVATFEQGPMRRLAELITRQGW